MRGCSTLDAALRVPDLRVDQVALLRFELERTMEVLEALPATPGAEECVPVSFPEFFPVLESLAER